MKPIALVLTFLLLCSTYCTTALTVSSTVGQSDFNDNVFEWPLTAPGNPFDFNGQPFAGLTAIDELSITLTLQDGDTFEGDIDYNSLTLILDGIDTGLFLNGFGLPGNPAEEDSFVVTAAVTGVPENGAAILAALQADGQLVASIRDRHTSHAPFGSNPNGIWVRGDFTTTLVITQGCDDSDLDGICDTEDSCPNDPSNDSDGDGVCGDADECPDSDLSSLVSIQGCQTGVANVVLAHGCTINDMIAEAAASASTHGQFVAWVAQLTNALKKLGVITGQQKGAIERCAGRSTIGK